MKDRFSTVDLFSAIHDLKCLENLRVSNIYDVNSKTYLIKFQHPGKKCFIIFESGMKIHVTGIDWPKAQFPSSFSMKLRKHIKQKRLVNVRQLGIDRIVDMQFGTEEFANHVIVELYDRGNVVLTDYEYTILNVLRPRTDVSTNLKIVGKEKYPVQNARQDVGVPDGPKIKDLLKAAKDNDLLRRVLSSATCYDPSLIEHCLIAGGFEKNSKVKAAGQDIERLLAVYNQAQSIFNSIRNERTKGYLTVVEQNRPDGSVLKTYEVYDSFSDCLDEYFSQLESQKVDRKALAVEREAMRKLENVRKDHEERIRSLTLSRAEKEEMAYLLELNSEAVDRALLVVRSAIANQMTWEMIEEMRLKAIEGNDPIARMITALDLNSNSMTVSLHDPYSNEGTSKNVAIDIGLSAYQNARKLHHEKKVAVDKEKRTIRSSAKALQSATQKTEKLLETVRLKSDIIKSRVPMWFEKFYWFISSESYLVIGGRDAQQNELLVKRYLRAGDLYVHADVRGAASVIVRNKPGKGEIPSKTLIEAGEMAVCYSSAWEAKISASAWWVHHDQVTRTAPTGEHLPSGSFMIRGKKNYLLTPQMQMGFGLLFKLDESSVERHKEDLRKKDIISSSDGAADQDVNQEVKVSDNDEEQELSGGGDGVTAEDFKRDSSDDDSNHNNNAYGGGDRDADEFPDIKLNVDEILPSGMKQDEFTILQIGPEDKAVKDKQSLPVQRTSDTVQKEKVGVQEKRNRPLTKREKHKADKIKKKYRDQDDEEREIRLLLLGSKPKDVQTTCNATGKSKIERTDKKSENSFQKKIETDEACATAETQPLDTRKSLPTEREEEDDDEKDLMFMEEEETKMMNSLTWRPYPEDTLLYAIVTVAPYSIVQKFKYKVKLTPGTGKRGKAAKAAISLFQKYKDASAQELAMMKVLAVDDQIGRNIPGKVRVSAKQMNIKQ